MLIDFSDIWKRIPEKPLWWFEGVKVRTLSPVLA
jgi:hypothetical protein